MTTVAALLIGFMCGYGVRELISRRPLPKEPATLAFRVPRSAR